MEKYGFTRGKKIRLKLDISGQADSEEIFALLEAVGSDNEEDIENLLGDSDTEFEALSEDAKEILQQPESDTDNGELRIKQLDAVIHLDVNEHDPVGPASVDESRILITNSKQPSELIHRTDDDVIDLMSRSKRKADGTYRATPGLKLTPKIVTKVQVTIVFVLRYYYFTITVLLLVLNHYVSNDGKYA